MTDNLNKRQNGRRTNCPNCGAPIKIGASHCEYCGTEFETGYVRKISVDCSHGIQVVQSKRRITRELVASMDPEELEKMMRYHIARDIAEYIMPLVEIETEEDIPTDEYIVNSRIRVIDPAVRF